MLPSRRPCSLEPFGDRIAVHRARLGMTQQHLAERVAMSRAAVSHLEGGLTTASERTVALLAGVFGLEPHELVAGTDYPRAKAERLPLSVNRYTEVDLALALVANDLEWCHRIGDSETSRSALERRRRQLLALEATILDPLERQQLQQAARVLTRQPGATS